MVITIAILLVLTYSCRQHAGNRCNGNIQPQKADSSAVAEDALPLVSSGLLTWHPYY